LAAIDSGGGHEDTGSSLRPHHAEGAPSTSAERARGAGGLPSKDRSHRPSLHTAPTPGPGGHRAVYLRQAPPPLDDLLAVTREFLNPAVSRPGLDRCLRHHGAEELQTHRFDSQADLATTLPRSAGLYNRHIPQRLLGHQTPVQSLKQWQHSHPHLLSFTRER
jgi:hypothetical protein